MVEEVRVIRTRCRRDDDGAVGWRASPQSQVVCDVDVGLRTARVRLHVPRFLNLHELPF